MTVDEAIRHLYTYSSTNGSGQTTDAQHEEAKRMAIKALKEQQWIPCSERLPDEDYWMVGIGKQFSANVLVTVSNREDEEELVDTSYTVDGEWMLELPRYCKIVAWMPLPEPWKGEQHE